jgi:hypothetical protein
VIRWGVGALLAAIVLGGCGGDRASSGCHGPVPGAENDYVQMTRTEACREYGPPDQLVRLSLDREEWFYPAMTYLFQGNTLIGFAVGTQGPYRFDSLWLEAYAQEPRMSPVQRAALLTLAALLRNDTQATDGVDDDIHRYSDANGPVRDHVCGVAWGLLQWLFQGPGPPPFSPAPVVAAAKRVNALLGPNAYHCP